MKKIRFSASRFVVGSAVVMMFGAHGCTLNPFAGISFDEAHEILAGASSSSSAGGVGGMGGAGGMGGNAGSGGAPCLCADDGNECTDDIAGMNCPNGDSLQCHQIRVDQPCNDGWCSKDGECKNCQTCTDPESCGDRCNGVQCATNLDCKTSICQTIASAPSLCCDKQCGTACKSCNRPGVEGTCTRMPVGLEFSGCMGGSLCDGNGLCNPIGGAALGAPCTKGTDCASGLCRAQYCRSDVNEPCIDDVECGTNLCDPVTKTCTSCILPNGPSCAAGSECDMAAGNCKSALGQPSLMNSECTEGMVSGFLCALPAGSTCEQHAECVSRNCVNKVCSAQCTVSGQCAAGTQCMNGACKLLPGNYCYENWLCQSGNCSGFPRRCQ